MPAHLSIALVLPHAWPPREDVAWAVEGAGAALARRGHAVTVLAPTRDPALLVAGRDALRALSAGDASGVLARPGEVRPVAVGRALQAGAGRTVAGPLDMATNLEAALTLAPFDVVHLHDPLAPSPGLAALRHARGVTAATFHGHDQLAGIAFLQPLVDRALARVDVCTAATEVARRALTEILPREYALVPHGVDPAVFSPLPDAPAGPPGVVVVARARDRAGLRFAMRALRLCDLPGVGRVTVVGPAEAPWRTRAALAKAVRPFVTVVADTGPRARADALSRGRIALLPTAAEVEGPAAREAMARGLAVLAPRCEELDRLVSHGADGLGLAPFAAPTWAAALDHLASDAPERSAMGAAAAARAGGRTWDAVAADLEDLYRDAAAARSAGRRPARRPAGDTLLADLRVRPGPGLDAAAILAACRERGLGAVGVAAPGGLGPARAVAAAAGPGLRVVVGQEIATEDGVIVGLALTRDVPDGLPLAAAAAAVRAQGGVVLVPHPASLPIPTPEALRRAELAAHCHEFVTAAAHGTGRRAAQLAQRLGIVAVAGSGATTADEVGLVAMRIRPFGDGPDLLDALAGGEILRRRRPILRRGVHGAPGETPSAGGRNREEQGK